MNNETIHIHTYQENLEIQNLAGFSLSLFFFMAMPGSLYNLCFPTRDQTHAPALDW